MIRRVARLLYATVSLVVATSGAIAAADAPSSSAAAGARAAYRVLPLMFEARGGDRDAPVALISHGHAERIAVTRDAVQVALPADRGQNTGDLRSADTSSGSSAGTLAGFVTLRFAGARAGARLRGLDALTARVHYLRDVDPSADRAGVPVFGRAAIEQLYPGIDAVFYGNGQSLEYDLVVVPGGHPDTIAMRVEGASAISLDDRGNVLIATPRGDLRLHRPIAWQDGAGGRTEIDAAFVLRESMEIAFAVGDYDRTRPLVIDPVIAYATYVGGSGGDGGLAIAVDTAGSAYVAGYTVSPDFPLTNAFDSSLNKKGDLDAFVAKLAPDGKSLVYATYLGGPTGRDTVTGIAVDRDGSAYVTGTTTAADFPVTANAYQKGTASGGSFVAKLNPTGNALVYSTYVAATTTRSLAIDAAGSAYITGQATTAFVTTPGAFQQTSPVSSGETGFVLKLNPAGSTASYATFLGGSGSGYANSIAVDSQGRAHVGGFVSGDFPLALPLDLPQGGNQDGYVSVLDASGSRLVSSTRIGGSRDDTVNALAIDANGAVYVAGETYSADFPSVNGFQPVKSGYRLVSAAVGNAFVAKLDLQRRAIVYSSFLGGEVCPSSCQLLIGGGQYPGDAAYGLAVDSDGRAYVIGLARSLTFPLVDSTSPRGQGSQNSAFVAKVSTAGATLLFSTFVRTGFAGSGTYAGYPEGSATGVAVDAAGAAYVTGASVTVDDFTATAGAFQSTDPGYSTPTVVKFSPPSHRLSIELSGLDVDAATPVTMTATVDGSPISGYVDFFSGSRAIGSAALDANRATVTKLLAPGIHSLSAKVSTPDGIVDAPALIQVVDQPLVCSK